jgi:hypothetical protein
VSPLLIGGDDDHKRLLEVIVVEAAGRGNRCCERTLHISRAAAHQASIFQRRRERLPAGVARHRVRMAEQAQPAGPCAPLGDQADLLLIGRVDIGDFLDREAAFLQHPAQKIGDRPVARRRLRGHCDQFTGKFDNVDVHGCPLSRSVFQRRAFRLSGTASFIRTMLLFRFDA